MQLSTARQENPAFFQSIFNNDKYNLMKGKEKDTLTVILLFFSLTMYMVQKCYSLFKSFFIITQFLITIMLMIFSCSNPISLTIQKIKSSCS